MNREGRSVSYSMDDDQGEAVLLPDSPRSVVFESGDNLEMEQKPSPARGLFREISTASSLSNTVAVNWIGDSDAKESLIGLLSALYAAVLLIFALTFELSTILNARKFVHVRVFYECFHIYLYGVSLAFFAYCYGFMLHRGWIRNIKSRQSTLRQRFSSKNLAENSENGKTETTFAERKKSMAIVTHSAPAAGSLYLRLGCVVFGIVGVVSFGMQMFECVEDNYNERAGHPQCGNLRFVKLVLAIIFTFIQMHFVFQNSKMTIHRSKNVGRFGTMHLVAVNLWVWMRHLMLEEFEVSREIDHNAQGKEWHEGHETTVQSTWDEGHTLPVIHSNLTSDLITGLHEKHRRSLEVQSSTIPPMDFFTLLNGCSDPESCFAHQTFAPMLTTCIIEYSLIAAGVMFVLWRNIGNADESFSKRRKQNLRVDCSSSTTGLFVGLMFLVATIVSMVVFYAKINKNMLAEALWVFSMTDTVLYMVSIFACVFGIWRTSKLSYETERHASGAELLHEILLIVGLMGQLLFCISGIVGLSSGGLQESFPPALVPVLFAHLMRLIQVLLQTIFILGASRLVATTSELQRKKPGRELITFLMVVNMALFLVNTFEGQKASANHALIEFYGQKAWAFVVQSTMPLTIFYRFHSSVCLAEIWKHSYRVRVRFTR